MTVRITTDGGLGFISKAMDLTIPKGWTLDRLMEKFMAHAKSWRLDKRGK